MPYDPLLAAEIASGKPLTSAMLTKIADNFAFLYSQLGSVAMVDVPNGNFEIDADGDGLPDSWTRYLYAGGAGGRTTATQISGTACLSMTHPGGAGNGGAYFESDYVPCNGGVGNYPYIPLTWWHWATAAGMHNEVQILWFDADQVILGSPTIIYDSLANPTTPAFFALAAVPPSGARFFKVRLVGGNSDTDAAGTAYFDAVALRPGMEIYTPGTQRIASVASAALGTGAVAKVAEIAAGKFGQLTVYFELAATTSSGDSCTGAIYVNGVQVGTTRTMTGLTTVGWSEDIYVAAGDLVQIYAAVNTNTGEMQNFELRAANPWQAVVSA